MNVHYFGHMGESPKTLFNRTCMPKMGVQFVEYMPEKVPETAAKIKEVLAGKPDLLVGRGIGAYHLLKALQKRSFRALLINPVTNPTVSLLKCIGVGFRNEQTGGLTAFSNDDYVLFDNVVHDPVEPSGVHMALLTEDTCQVKFEWLEGQARAWKIETRSFKKPGAEFNKHFRELLPK